MGKSDTQMPISTNKLRLNEGTDLTVRGMLFHSLGETQ